MCRVNLHSLRKRKGWKTGRTGCFEKGQAAPFNKGVKCPQDAAATIRSTKDAVHKRRAAGVAVKLYKPIGTERVSKDGYRERKIHDGMPLQSRWRAVHLIEWEAVNGPIPKGPRAQSAWTATGRIASRRTGSGAASIAAAPWRAAIAIARCSPMTMLRQRFARLIKYRPEDCDAFVESRLVIDEPCLPTQRRGPRKRLSTQGNVVSFMARRRDRQAAGER
jgi:hypothetical protein